MQKPTKPSKPSEPKRPEVPSSYRLVHHSMNINDHCNCNLNELLSLYKDFIKKSYPNFDVEQLNFNNVFISIDNYGDYDCNNTDVKLIYQDGIKVEKNDYEKKLDDKRYKKELNKYEKKLAEHPNKLKAYSAKLEKYKKELELFESKEKQEKIALFEKLKKELFSDK